MTGIGFRYLVAKRGGVSFSVTDLVLDYTFQNRFSTQRAANKFADGLAEAEAERQESARFLDGWCL